MLLQIGIFTDLFISSIPSSFHLFFGDFANHEFLHPFLQKVADVTDPLGYLLPCLFHLYLFSFHFIFEVFANRDFLSPQNVGDFTGATFLVISLMGRGDLGNVSYSDFILPFLSPLFLPNPLPFPPSYTSPLLSFLLFYLPSSFPRFFVSCSDYILFSLFLFSFFS